MTLSYNELRPETLFVLEGAPHKVLSYEFLRMQQRKPVARLKIKNLVTGKVYEYTAHPQDSFEEADVEIKPLAFLYAHRGEYWFHEPGNPAERISLSAEAIGEGVKFLNAGATVNSFVFEDNIIGIELPIKIDLKVTEAPPSIRGDTARAGNKTVTLETGAEISAPLFIKEGDIVRVNTETGEYVERVSG